MLDLTDRILQTPAQTPTPRPPTLTRAANGHVKWHGGRRLLQLLVGALFVALPLTNGLRLDVRRDEFYFAWHKMAAHDLFLLFWVSMLGVTLFSAVSFLYGRLWCGWVCPQTLASDFADSLKRRLDKAFRTRPGKPRFALSRGVWTLAVLAVSLGTGVTLACYWLAPTIVFQATAAPWRDVSAGLTVYGLAAVLAADMLWLRRRFCSHACPYGPLISTLGDKNTLAVRFLTERADECIGCHKCEVDCPMGIDIKQGVGQHGCIGCGECVDSCNDVLGRRGIPGLIEFRYGVEPDRASRTLPLPLRLGLWDARRVGVALSVPLCLGVVLFLMYGHWPLTASVTAAGPAVRGPVEVSNRFLLTVGNGMAQPTTFALTVRGLAGAQTQPRTLTVPAHESRTLPVLILGPTATVAPGRTPVGLRVSGGGDSHEIKTIFYAPVP